MNQHHQVLKNNLKITIPKIDAMIDAALNAGAYGSENYWFWRRRVHCSPCSCSFSK